MSGSCCGLTNIEIQRESEIEIREKGEEEG